MLSVFITPWTKPDQHPSRQQRRLDGDDRFEQREVGALGRRGGGMVPRDRVVGEAPQQVDVARGRGVLEAPHPQVAAGDAGEDGARQKRLSLYRAPGAHYGQGSGSRDTESVHRLADDVFAQHRPDDGQAVTAARERRGPGTLEMDVANAPVGVDELAEQQRAPVAQPRDEAAELMPGVCLGYRSGAAGHQGADQEPQTVGTPQPSSVEAELRWPAAR